jgi:hypothetical protein
MRAARSARSLGPTSLARSLTWYAYLSGSLGRFTWQVHLAGSFAAKLADGTEPVFHVEGLGDLAVPNGLDIDRHDPKTLAGMRHAKQVARRCAGHLAANDHAIARDQHFLDVEFHVRNAVGKIRDHLDRGLAAPAFARQITGAGFIIVGQDLLLDRFNVAAAGDVKQAVPGRDGGAGLRFSEAGYGFFLDADRGLNGLRLARSRDDR